MGEPVEIDVLVVCQHDADMVRRCLTSCKEGATNKVNLWLWVNGLEGDAPREIVKAAWPVIGSAFIRQSRKNLGFIKPNNKLAALGSAPYVCLLNADTVCAPGWDVPLVSKLTTGTEYWEQPTREHPDGRHEVTNPPSIVGYSGGWLSGDGIGRYAAFPGAPCDYVEGWCLMTTRAVWEALGGFDEDNLTMAYGEDSDLCLRARERGWGVKAVENWGDHPELDGPYYRVEHLRDTNGGQGRGATEETRQSPELAAAMRANHAYLRERHKAYLERDRVLVKGYRRPDLWTFNADGLADRLEGRKGFCLGLPGGHGGPNTLAALVTAVEVDGRLWQWEIAGRQPQRFLVP